jgi:hypothetical protein
VLQARNILTLAAEEQPQQNNHRDRHAQQPQQNSSSHLVTLLDSSRLPGQREVTGKVPREKARWHFFGISENDRRKAYQWPVFGIEDHGSAGGFGSPFCNSSIECRSGERTNAMLPSRGGRLMVTPIFISLSQVA